jgi:hypothetical protein
VGNFQMEQVAPGLLSHPTAATPAMNDLKRRQIFGMVMKPHETAGAEQLEHVRLPVSTPAVSCHGQPTSWGHLLVPVWGAGGSLAFVSFLALKS